MTALLRFARTSYRLIQSDAVGVFVANTNDYHLYVTNLPDEFTPDQVVALYGLCWKVEVLFWKLKSQHGLEKFNTSDEAIVELLMLAALLTLMVSRVLLAMF